jgi:hypothetical protein
MFFKTAEGRDHLISYYPYLLLPHIRHGRLLRFRLSSIVFSFCRSEKNNIMHRQKGRFLEGNQGMTTDYNPIAEQYGRSKHQTWRTYIETFILMNLIGDPAGR